MQGKNVFIIFTLVLLLIVLFFNQGEQNVPPPTVFKDGNKKVELQAGLNDPRDPQQNTPDPYTPKPVRISTSEEKPAGAQEHWRGLKGNALRSNIYTLEKPISSREVLDVGQLLTLNLFDDVIIVSIQKDQA